MLGQGNIDKNKMLYFIGTLTLFIFPLQCNGKIYHEYKFQRSDLQGSMLYIGNKFDWLKTENLDQSALLEFASVLIELKSEEDIKNFFQVDKSDFVDIDIVMIIPSQIVLSNVSSLANISLEIERVNDHGRKSQLGRQYFGRISTLITEKFINPSDYQNSTDKYNQFKRIVKQLSLLGISYGFQNTYDDDFPSVKRIIEKTLEDADYPSVKMIIEKILIREFSEIFYSYEDFSIFILPHYNEALQVKPRGSDPQPELVVSIGLSHVDLLTAKELTENSIKRYGQVLAKYLYSWSTREKVRAVYEDYFTEETATNEISGIESLKEYLFHEDNMTHRGLADVFGSYLGSVANPDTPGFLHILCEGGWKEMYITMALPSENGKPDLNLFQRGVSRLSGLEPALKAANCDLVFSVEIQFEFRNTGTEVPSVDEVITAFLAGVGDHQEVFNGLFFSMFIGKGSCGVDAPIDSIWQGELAKVDITRLRQVNISLGIRNECLEDPEGDLSNSSLKVLKRADYISFNPGATFFDLGFSGWLIKKQAQLPDLLSEDRRPFWRLGSNEYNRDEWKFDCRAFKSHRSQLKTWSYIHDFTVDFQPFLRCTFGVCDGGFLTQDAIDFININGPCLVFDHERPLKPLEFSKDLSGVTFDLSKQFIRTLSYKELVKYLDVIQAKFNKIEIVLSSDRNFPLALSSMKKGSSSNLIHMSQYYIHLGRLRRSQDSPIISEVVGLEGIEGFHFELPVASIIGKVNYSADVQRNLKWLKSISRKKAGVTFEFFSHQTIDNLMEKVLPFSDYIIIDVPLDQIMLLFTEEQSADNPLGETKLRQVKKDLTFKAVEAINKNLKSTLLHDLFLRLRGDRIIYRQTNPEIDITLRFRWPSLKKGALNSAEYLEAYIRVWRIVQEFSEAYNFPFIIYDAFDKEDEGTGSVGNLQFGWWTVKGLINGSLGVSSRIVEKQEEYFKQTLKTFNQDKREDSSTGTNLAAAIAATALSVSALFIVGIVVLVVFLRRRFGIISRKELNEFKYGIDQDTETECPGELHIFGMKYNKNKYEIEKDDFRTDMSVVIGKGNFGTVYKTHMERFHKEVAVKTPKRSLDQTTVATSVRSLLREIKVMSFVGEHENVLALLGAYTKEIEKGVVHVITELCEQGSLLEVLRKKGAQNQDDDMLLYELYQFCQDICNGMQYLREKHVIHGDLSARNVLVNKYGVCKISDFGLAKTMERYETYVKKSSEPLPWPWMAIESLQRMEFTLKSDIWSLGVTLWEVFTLGEQPYPGLNWDVEFVQRLKDGLRLPKPRLATPEVYNIIITCWDLDPGTRPEPSTLITFLQGLRGIVYTDLIET